MCEPYVGIVWKNAHQLKGSQICHPVAWIFNTNLLIVSLYQLQNFNELLLETLLDVTIINCTIYCTRSPFYYKEVFIYLSLFLFYSILMHCVQYKFYMSKRCQFKVCSHHPLYYCIMFTRSSVSCLLAFYGIPIFLTFRIFNLLVSFPSLLHSHALCAIQILGHNAPIVALTLNQPWTQNVSRASISQ